MEGAQEPQEDPRCHEAGIRSRGRTSPFAVFVKEAEILVPGAVPTPDILMQGNSAELDRCVATQLRGLSSGASTTAMDVFFGECDVDVAIVPHTVVAIKAFVADTVGAT